MADANIRFLGIHDIGAHRGEAAGTLMQTAEAHARTIGAVALVTTWRHDPNDNHLITSILGRRVAGRMNLPLFEYPLSSWTLPTRRVLDAQVPTGFRLDVLNHLEEKRRAIKCHDPELFKPSRDSSNGTAMESRLLACFSGRFETFIRVPVGGPPPISSPAASCAPVIPTWYPFLLVGCNDLISRAPPGVMAAIPSCIGQQGPRAPTVQSEAGLRQGRMDAATVVNLCGGTAIE